MFIRQKSEAGSCPALKDVTPGQSCLFVRGFIEWDFDFECAYAICRVIPTLYFRDKRRLYLYMGVSGTAIKAVPALRSPRQTGAFGARN